MIKLIKGRLIDQNDVFHLETMKMTIETPTIQPNTQVHTSVLSGLIKEKNPEYSPPNRPEGFLTMIETPADI